MRYRFEPVDKSPNERLLEALSALDGAGDVVAAAMMPVYLVLVALISWFDAFSVLSALVGTAVAINCWPASRGLRSLLAGRSVG